MQLLKLPAYISLGAKNVKIGEKTFQLNEQPKMSSFFKDFIFKLFQAKCTKLNNLLTFLFVFGNVC